MYTLIRERDKLNKVSKKVKWIDWNQDRSYKGEEETPRIGLSLLMSPFNRTFTWQTTTITEIVESREGYIKFKTENSVYELTGTSEDFEDIEVRPYSELGLKNQK